MRFPARTLALVSATGLALVGLTVPSASAASTTLAVKPGPAYGAKSTTETITGTAYYAGDTVALNLSSGGTVTAPRTTTAASDGTWSYTFSAADVQSVPDGTVTVTAAETYCTFLGGPVGPVPCAVLQNQTTTQVTGTFVKDLYVPPAPSLAALGSNFVINNANQSGVTATGQAEANSSVTLKLGTLTQTATVNSSGLWSMFFDASGLADGTYTASVTEAEAGGAHNVGPAATKSVLKDSAAPTRTASSPAAGSTVGPPAKVSVTFNKTLASNSTITLKTSGGTTVTCPVTVSGTSVSCAPSPALKSGGYTATTTAYDAHGNVGTSSSSFTVDATAPAVTNLKSTNTSATATKSTVTGAVSEAATLTVTSADSTGAKASASLKATNAGNFSIAVDENALGGGTITVTVKAVDVYGNASTYTTTHSRTVPAGTTVSLSVPGWSAVGWPVTLSGSVHLAKAGAYGSVTLVHSSLSGKQQVLATVSVGSNGSYSFRYTPGTSGTYYAIYNAVSGSGAQSPTYSSQVRYAISASSATGPASANAVIGGAVHNPPAGAYVLIYRRNADGSWTQLGKAIIDSTYHYRFTVVLPKGSTAIRVTIPSSHGYFSNSANFTATRT
ncbi:hypothetical protein Back2_22490 [Nocardioides baekrokdamisoli]|uniref:CopC domain-containing protein n=1 Tax=Nocardioides baekrokdamisoli TaxID=1804624 RepID=A0A3G9IIB3_9ACTN|nr:Ig-like domain-containing protein [Nocardioides baekrokdamisoli]BBH17962.1 hypothetical protein Back2_22490 [Nocardioides baekrokdamisoli]